MDSIAWSPVLDLPALLQLGLAVLCGGAIGLEREARGRAAGLRTMILVCVGSTLIMIVSHRLASPVAYANGAAETIVRIDPGRIAAGIVTGIGFLGAAVVLKLGDLIRGVTTAASIWFVAALGIVLGEGFFALALLATAIGLIVLWVFAYFERWIPSPLYREIRIVTRRGHAVIVLERTREALAGRGVRVLEIHAREDVVQERSELLLRVRTLQGLEAPNVVQALSELEHVLLVDWH